MRKLLVLLFAGLFMPAAAQTDTAIRWFEGADIYTVTGDVIPQGTLGIKNGKIIYIGSQAGAPLRAGVTDVSGKRIYPGLIALNSILGLSEMEAVRATNDFNEVGENNAHVSAAIAFNTDSRIIPTVISNGVLMAQVCPRGGIISGSSSVMKLQARNWEEATYKLDGGLHINWLQYDGEDEAIKKKVAAKVDEMILWLKQAQSYAATKPAETNLKFEGMKGIFNSSKKVFLHTDDARTIVYAVKILKELKITPIVVGGNESHLITKFLKENNVAVIISRTHNLPANYDDSYDAMYKLPYQLYKDSVQFAIADINFWEQRNLPFEAGQAVAFGLPYEEALKAVTITPAKLLGVDATTGSLEIGKDATFIITDGDILDMRTSNVTQAFLQGVEINLNNHQKDLYEKYHQLFFNKKP